MYAIDIDNRSGEELPSQTYLELAAFVLEQEGVKQNSEPAFELSISLVGVEEIHTLNRSYRGIDAPTDVLSFENDGELLGDVIICPAIARQHAADFATDFASEMNLMLVHGCLHLLGYDHLEDDEATAMENRENQLLKNWASK